MESRATMRIKPPSNIPSAEAMDKIFREHCPDIHKFIMGLPGAPHITGIAFGHDDHVTFIVDPGFGFTVKSLIEDFCGVRPRIGVEHRGGFDAVTWWA